MGTDETLARLKLLSERLDRVRRQAREVQDTAVDEVRNAYRNQRQRDMPNFTERRANKRTRRSIS